MDGDWKSRKFWLAVFTMTLIYVAWFAAGRPVALFGELCTGLIVAAGIYKGSNIAEAWFATKKPSPSESPVTPKADKK